jgi:hypothetical protein
MTMMMVTRMVIRMVMERYMRRVSIAEAKTRLSREWLGDEPIELTANNLVVATVFPAAAMEAGAVQQWLIQGADSHPVNSDPRVPHGTGVAAADIITPAQTTMTDRRVPHSTGVATQTEARPTARLGLSKADQASGKSRLR